MSKKADVYSYLAEDRFEGSLLGRVWLPGVLTGSTAGPSPMLVSEDAIYDPASLAP